ncbi:hypothetical protein [uncultured Sunxiuqinia sp.]|nr:hypothetical protein [uncultured Sunxiuqinia sp.]
MHSIAVVEEKVTKRVFEIDFFIYSGEINTFRPKLTVSTDYHQQSH